jgi:sugar O-acyltransferase (sialic acid O-acetyltransferase NeuD family)
MHLLVYCFGGFGKEVIDIARRLNIVSALWETIAFLDDAPQGNTYYGAGVFRLESVQERLGTSCIECVIANGEPVIRKALAERLAAAGIPLTSLIDAGAVVSESAHIGRGAVIFPGCYISSSVQIGLNVAIVAGSTIGHDTVLADHAVISGHVNVGGACTIGSESFIGMGSQIKENTRIGKSAIVGMGSVVCGDIPDEVIAMGNPCRPLRPNLNRRVFS